eukprot:UN23786
MALFKDINVDQEIKLEDSNIFWIYTEDQNKRLVGGMAFMCDKKKQLINVKYIAKSDPRKHGKLKCYSALLFYTMFCFLRKKYPLDNIFDYKIELIADCTQRKILNSTCAALIWIRYYGFEPVEGGDHSVGIHLQHPIFLFEEFEKMFLCQKKKL